ncbi:MAG: TonB-dependent receptor, partial [Prolixibacteraceae bacterium]|nr:TonB-dependent receptor [Prolixibacteraceae bacterium]
MKNQGIFFVFRKAIFSIIILIFVTKSFSQDIDSIKISGNYENFPLTNFFESVKEKFDVRFFYQNEWIENLKVNQRFNETPLYQALVRIFNNTGYSFEVFQKDVILISPSQGYGLVNPDIEGIMTVIGDPLNIGRYKTAILSGKIRNGKNGEPLVGAVLYVPKLEKGTSSDSNGNFKIELPPDEYNLQLSFMGFEQNNRRIRLIESGNIDLELFEESQSIGEVTVTGEGQNISRTQMSMVKVDSKVLKELPVLMGEADVIKSLTMMAGVQTVSELASGFNVRGGSTDQNLILVNGSPVFNPSHLFGFFSMLNPDVINDVKLYKGGMPAKFGERVSSVMEVDIKEGNDETILFYGGIGLLNSRLTLDGPLSKNKKLKVLVGGRTSYSDWILKKIPDSELSESVTNFYDISGKISYNFDLHNKLNLMIYSSNDEFSTSSQSITEYGNLLANLMVRNRWGDKLNGELNLSFSSYKSRLTDLANDKTFESFFLDNQLNYTSGKYHFSWHPHELHNVSFGWNLIHYSLNPGKIIPAAKETVINGSELQQEKAVEYAGYLSDEFMLSPSVTFNLGLRVSGFLNIGPKTVYFYNEDMPKSPESVIDSMTYGKNKVAKSFIGLEPRFSINVSLTDEYALKLSYQRTRQYIGQISNNAVISPTETWKMSDYYLNPLISDQLALGIDGGIKNKFHFTGEVFFKKLQNLIEYKNGAEIVMNPHLETELIPSDGFAYGIELSTSKTTGRLTGMVNYMFSRTMKKTDNYFPEEQINLGDWYPSIYDKPHDLSVTATYHISRRWRLSGNFIYISGRP